MDAGPDALSPAAAAAQEQRVSETAGVAALAIAAIFLVAVGTRISRKASPMVRSSLLWLRAEPSLPSAPPPSSQSRRNISASLPDSKNSDSVVAAHAHQNLTSLAIAGSVAGAQQKAA